MRVVPLPAIGDLVAQVSSWTPGRDDPEGEFIYVDLSAVDQDSKTIASPRRLVGRDAPSRARQIIRSGDVLVSTVRPNLNAVGRVPVELNGATASTGFCVLRPRAEMADGAYLFHWVRSPHFVGEMVRRATGASYPAVSDRIVCESRIPLPPLPEQRRIAEILDKADALRAKRRAALAQLDTLAQSIFFDMFGDPVSNRMGWKEHEVEKVCRLVRGSSPRPKGDPQFYGGPVPRLMVSDITRDGFWVTPRIDSLTEAGAKQSRRVPAGTVVMAVSGEVGVVATVQDPCCVHDGFVAFLDLDESVFDSCFFMFQFHSLKMTHERRKAGAIFQNLTTRDVKAMRLPTPSIDLQNRFAAIVESVERQKAVQRTHLVELDTLFASLQSRAFRGEL